MSNKNTLNVWYEEALVGILWQDDIGRIGFTYENSWINHGFPISHQLPLSLKDYPPELNKAHPFFANLLPEAEARIHIVQDLKISNSDFELLKAIGGECAGALSILPQEYQPNHNADYKILTDEELKTLILHKGTFTSLMRGKKRPRLSLAGAHDKCPIYVEDNQFFLPQQYSSSTHILKFSISEYRNIQVYEYFLTYLAKSIGLPVVDIDLRRIDKEYFLLINRYDRIVYSLKKIKRLHQEDFCQALGVGYYHKYQQEGGPSFQDCYHLIDQSATNPIKDKDNLLRWQIFNVLAGNSDGHAKNISILYNEDQQAQLAPFYDLVCTRAVTRIYRKLALSVGGEFYPDKIKRRHWITMANECHIREKYLIELVTEISEALLCNLKNAQEVFEATFGSYPALQRIHQVITKQCRIILKSIE